MTDKKFNRAEAFDMVREAQDLWQRYFDMTGRSLIDDQRMAQVIDSFDEDGTLNGSAGDVWVEIYNKEIEVSLGPDEGTLSEFEWMDFQTKVQDALEEADLKVEEDTE